MGIWWWCDGHASNASLLSRKVIDAYSAGSPAVLSRKTLMPKIMIVETGLVSPERRARHGSFPQMFERLIGEADASASFVTVRLVDGEELPDPARRGIGRHVYDVVPDNGAIDGEKIAIACSHQDQVIEPPARATTILHSTFTPYAGLLYENGATLSVQPHPEFTTAFAHICCELRRGSAPETLVATAKASLEQPLDSADLGRAIKRFLAKPRKS